MHEASEASSARPPPAGRSPQRLGPVSNSTWAEACLKHTFSSSDRFCLFNKNACRVRVARTLILTPRVRGKIQWEWSDGKGGSERKCPSHVSWIHEILSLNSFEKKSMSLEIYHWGGHMGHDSQGGGVGQLSHKVQSGGSATWDMIFQISGEAT